MKEKSIMMEEDKYGCPNIVVVSGDVNCVEEDKALRANNTRVQVEAWDKRVTKQLMQHLSSTS